MFLVILIVYCIHFGLLLDKSVTFWIRLFPLLHIFSLPSKTIFLILTSSISIFLFILSNWLFQKIISQSWIRVGVDLLWICKVALISIYRISLRVVLYFARTLIKHPLRISISILITILLVAPTHRWFPLFLHGCNLLRL